MLCRRILLTKFASTKQLHGPRNSPAPGHIELSTPGNGSAGVGGTHILSPLSRFTDRTPVIEIDPTGVGVADMHLLRVRATRMKMVVKERMIEGSRSQSIELGLIRRNNQ
jgi:hypothetical protein